MSVTLVKERGVSAAGSVLIVALLSACLFPSGPTVEAGIAEDGSWWVTPERSVQSGESFRLSFENRSDQVVEYVVVVLFDGQPDALPMRNGVLDVALSGVVSDPEAPDVAKFGVAYSKVGIQGEGGAGFEPAVIGPGKSQTVTIGDPAQGGGEPGEYVVLSFLPGRYEEGDYVSFLLTDPEGRIPVVDQPDQPGSSALQVGESLPAWSGPTVDGGTFTSPQLKGAQSLIILLTDGHELAGDALSTFSSLATDFGDEIGFVVVDTFQGVDRNRLIELIDETQVKSPVVFDETGELAEIAKPEWPGIYWIFTDESGTVTAIETGIPLKGELAILFDQG